MRSLTFVGLALTLVLALLGARIFLSGEESERLVALVLLAGAIAGLGLALWVPARAALAVAGVGLGLVFLLFVSAVLAATIKETPFGWLDSVFWFALLATPVAVVVFACVRLAEELPVRRGVATAAGVGFAVAVTLAISAPGAEWLAEPPSARYARIDEVRGSYGPLALGDSRAAIFAAFGTKKRAGVNEPLSPTGAGDSYEGPTFIPVQSPDFYRYEDVAIWLDRDEVNGFELTSPGARTSRGIGVGSGLDDVREAYPELECGEAPSGDFGSYPYCAGRLAPGRWIWFGGDPVSTITVSAWSFE
jgi:hypothetical protein